jgi:large subunit ribosomal protein L17
MRHGKALRQLSRNTSHRRALLRNMATSFFEVESFETTLPKAKELRPIVERLITLGKNDTLSSRRQAYSYLLSKAVVAKLFTDIGPRCSARNGGYTRIVRTRVRPGDAAEMAIIELVDKSTEGSSKGSSKSEGKASGEKKAAPKKVPAKKAAPKKAAEKAPAKKKAASK